MRRPIFHSPPKDYPSWGVIEEGSSDIVGRRIRVQRAAQLKTQRSSRHLEALGVTGP